MHFNTYFSQVGDIFSISEGGKENEVALACQNGIFYIRVKDYKELDPVGTELAFQKMQVFQIAAA